MDSRRATPGKVASGSREPGRIVAVWGPTGAPGRSTVAAALAGALADRVPVVLVDADLARGALGVLLGAAVGGNVASASRFPPPSGRPCPPDHLYGHRAGFALLPGVPGPAQGISIDPDELAALLHRLRHAFDLVVIDVGWALPDHEYGQGHLAALRAANLVVVIATATRLGVTDLLLQYPVLAAQLGVASEGGPIVWGVLNNGTGAHLETQTRRLRDDLGLPVVCHVPHDRDTVMLAQERSLPLTAVRRTSPACHSLSRLAERVWRELSSVPREGKASP